MPTRESVADSSRAGRTTAASDVELRDLLIRSQQLKSMPRDKETRRGQLFNAFPRDLLGSVNLILQL
jgi:hypothetical protein